MYLQNITKNYEMFDGSSIGINLKEQAELIALQYAHCDVLMYDSIKLAHKCESLANMQTMLMQ